jgi:hypothetical protein
VEIVAETLNFAHRRRSSYPVDMKFLCALFSCVTVFLPLSAAAQQASGARKSAAQAAEPVGTVSGTVTDGDGATVQGATVDLTNAPANQHLSILTTSDGHFRFKGVDAGNLTIEVTATGLAPTSLPANLQPGQSLELPPIMLRVATANTDVEVTLTQQEIAEEDMHIAEKQRLIGFVPNFYVVYDWHAPPLTATQKFKLAGRTLIDPASFIIVGGIAGIEQATDAFSGYHQGAMGYAKRYAAGFGDFGIGTMLGGAVLPVLFHQDPRYFYKGTGTVRARTLYALSTSVIARGDNGRWQPAYASVLGDFSSGAISNLYYPDSNRTGARLTVENGLLGIAFNGIGNVIQEFVLRRLTPGSNKPAPVNP